MKRCPIWNWLSLAALASAAGNASAADEAPAATTNAVTLDTKKEALEAASQLELLTGLPLPLANTSAKEEKK